MKSLEEKGVRGEKILTKKDRSERNQKKKEVVGNRPRVQNTRTIRPRETDLAENYSRKNTERKKPMGKISREKTRVESTCHRFTYLLNPLTSSSPFT